MADGDKNLSGKMADFLTQNGYHVDDQATKELRASPNPTGVERKIYTNGSAYVCAQTDNKTYVALNKAHAKEVPTKEWIIEGMHGGRVQGAQDRTVEELHTRLQLIAKDNGIPLVAAKGPEKARV